MTEAMNETKKLEHFLDLASNLESRFRGNKPGYTRIQYRHQEALWTCSLYITKTTKTSPGRTGRAGLHRALTQRGIPCTPLITLLKISSRVAFILCFAFPTTLQGRTSTSTSRSTSIRELPNETSSTVELAVPFQQRIMCKPHLCCPPQHEQVL